ncbi:hypothetical protein ACLUTX_28755 [Enterobacterales bacterium AE_CKDN230030158-1A_HGKHYDSX7]
MTTNTIQFFRFSEAEYQSRCDIAKVEYANTIAATSINGGALVRVSASHTDFENLPEFLTSWNDQGYTFIKGSGMFLAGNQLAGIWPEYNCTFAKPAKAQEKELKIVYARVLEEYTNEIAAKNVHEHERQRELALEKFRRDKAAAEQAAEDAYLAQFEHDLLASHEEQE